MSGVTDRIASITQPDGGFLPLNLFREETIPTSDELYPQRDENVDPALIGSAVDYLARIRLGQDREKVFKRSLEGAREAGEENYARGILSQIDNSLTTEDITRAIILASFDGVPTYGRDSITSSGVAPNEKTAQNIRTMVERAADFFSGRGKLIDTGIEFQGASTDRISGGEADYLTEDTLWDLKTTVGVPNENNTLQILIYARMGLHTGRNEFKNLKKIGIYNARLSRCWTLDIDSIDKNTLLKVDRDVIGYSETKPMNSNESEGSDEFTSAGDISHFDVSLSTPEYFSYVEYHTDSIIRASNRSRMKVSATPFSFIRNLSIDNHTDTGYSDLLIEISFSSSLFSPLTIHTGPILPMKVKENLQDQVNLSVDSEKLYGISGIVPCTVNIEVKDLNTGSTLASTSKEVQLLPIEQCSNSMGGNYPLLLTKYCVTDFADMKTLHHKAVEINGKALIGYQNSDVNDIVHEVESIYKAIHQWGIAYSNPPQSPGKTQNIRLPNMVLSQKMGTCIDLAILFCSALVEVGLNPVLIIIEGHALAGFFLDETTRYDYVEDRVSKVLNDAVGIDQKLVLVECTYLDFKNSCSFQQAIDRGTDEIRGYRGYFAAADVNTCQNSCFKPIPLPRDNGKVDLEIPEVELSDDALRTIERRALPPVRETKEDRFTVWEKKLLDLTRSNKLVDFRPNKRGDNWAPILELNAEDIFNVLKERKDDSSLDLKLLGGTIRGQALGIGMPELPAPFETHDDAVKTAKKGTIYTVSNDRTLKKLISVDNSSRQETGFPTLYLAIGSISGTIARRELRTPFLLVPATLTKRRVGEGYKLTYDLDSIMVNQTFFEYVKLNVTGSDYSPLYGITSDDEYRYIASVFRSIESNVNLELDDSIVYLANFTFAHYVMWRDMRDRREELEKNPIVRSLVENRSLIENTPVLDDKSADELDDVSKFAAPLPYDSTQLKAIVESAAGNSFILDGPPGTGKSQTIVNMICNAMYNGKSVLFVAEKQAALEVVRKRLANLKFDGVHGLDTFALQLYSAKADKKHFFDQLKEAMDLGGKRSQEDLEALGDDILKKRKKIVRELKELHDVNGRYLSLFSAYNLMQNTKDFAGRISIPDGFHEDYDSDKDNQIRELLKSIDLEVHSIPEYPNIPSSAFSFTDISPEVRDKAPDLIRNHIRAYDDLIDRLHALSGLIGVPLSSDFKDIESDIQSFKEALDSRDDLEKIENSEYFTDERAHYKTLKIALEIQSKDSFLLQYLTEEGIRNFPLEEVEAALAKINRSIFGKLFFKSKPFKLMAQYSRAIGRKQRPDNRTIERLCYGIRNRRELSAKVESDDLMKEFAGFDLTSIGADISALKSRYSSACRIRDHFFISKESHDAFVSFGKALNFNSSQLENALYNLEQAFQTFRESEKALYQVLPIRKDALKAKDYREFFESLATYLDEPMNREGLTHIARINKFCSKLNKIKLSDLSKAIKDGRVKSNEAYFAFRNALATQIINSYMSQSYPKNFSSAQYSDLLSEYDKAIREYRELSVQAVAQKVTCGHAGMNFAKVGPVGNLNKMISNHGRGTTIRKVLLPEGYESVFRSYFPCFLMSPLAVAQYLSPQARKFDIVIFDEASQIPTAEGVGPIARGKALIVGGDPKQMPPNQHFTANINDIPDDDQSEDYSKVDSESLLDDCIALELPDRKLAFHYRSRHESLIEYSNQNFYGGNLFTFPSPDSSTPHIEFKLVDSSEKIDSNLSTQEKNAILDCIKAVLTSPETHGKSLGVILFNVRQQQEISDAVDRMFSDDSQLAERAHWNSDPDDESRMFIKNLESVQGDERDIIILSIGFPKNHDGSAKLSGPLMEEGGERRLNVAASRARERMIVISTIEPSDIRAEGHLHDGASSLKSLLEYAKHASAPERPTDAAELSTSGATELLRERLESAGYSVDIDVGKSEFKVDIAVKNKEDASGKYILGILLDNQPPSQNTSTTDRFIIEPDFLSSLGWRIIRVYTFDLISEPETTIGKILEALKETPSEVASHQSQSSVAIPEMVQAPNELEKFIEPYRKADYTNVHQVDYQTLMNYGVRASKNLARYLLDMLSIESPVSYTRIKEFSKPILGISKVGSRADSFILRSLNLIRDLRVTKDYDDEHFYWRSDQSEIDRFRKSDRNIVQIPKEEIAFLMSKIVEFTDTKIDRNDLIAQTAAEMDISLTSKAREKLNYCLDYAKEQGVLKDNFVESYSDR